MKADLNAPCAAWDCPWFPGLQGEGGEPQTVSHELSVLSHFSPVRFFATHGQWPARLLSPWDSSDKNTGVGCHTLLQGIFLEDEYFPTCYLISPARVEVGFANTWSTPPLGADIRTFLPHPLGLQGQSPQSMGPVFVQGTTLAWPRDLCEGFSL